MRGVIVLLSLLVIGGVSLSVVAAEEHEGWTTNYQQALAAAKQQRKPIIALFTGSDWCPPCKKLEATVFQSEEFKKWAKNKAVLLFLDYPRSKPQDDATKQQNEKLSKQYKVQGFPSVVFMNAAGKEADRQVGYGGASPAEWIQAADAALRKVK
jgi:protein disulfide-isomerase